MKRTPMKRSGRIRPRPDPEHATYMANRMVVWKRAAGRCECCGRRLDEYRWHCHHRRLRSYGVDHRVVNLLALCPDCHTSIHANPQRSREFGTLVASWQRPEDVPVMLSLAWWQLDNEGGKVRVSAGFSPSSG